jgi:hypothetical protein
MTRGAIARTVLVLPLVALCACPAKKVLLTRDELATVEPTAAIEVLWAEPDGEFEVLGGLREPIRHCEARDEARARAEREAVPFMIASAMSLGADALLLHLPRGEKLGCRPEEVMTGYALRREPPGTPPPPLCAPTPGAAPVLAARSCVACPPTIEGAVAKAAIALNRTCLDASRGGHVEVRFDVGLFGEALFPSVVEDTTGLQGAAACILDAVSALRFGEADGGLCRVDATFRNPKPRVVPR